MKAGYAIGVGIGILFVVLGISSVVYFFTVKQIMGHSTSIYGNYFVAGLVCFFFAIVVLRLTIPAFIPLKKNNLPTVRTCQYCGAIVDEDALSCKKCKQQLSL
jgi:Na+/proline symporter